MSNQLKCYFGLQNFRSVERGVIDIRPITVLTGANGAGKSSFMYGLMAMRNLVANSNQPADSLFNLGFTNLGGIKEVVTKKEVHRTIAFELRFINEQVDSTYIVHLGQSPSLHLIIAKPFGVQFDLNVSFPYPLVQNIAKDILLNGQKYKLTFNGIAVEPVPTDTSVKIPQSTFELFRRTTLPVGIARWTDYIDVKRGFFRSTYASVPPGVSQSGEEETASLLAADRDLEARVSVTIEKMFNKAFSARPTALGAATFYLQTTDKETGFVCDLVNEGFGLNQLVYLLTKALRPGPFVACIEEPETHLHPEVITKLTEQLLTATRRENRRFLISSHSEHFVVSLLNLVAQGKASPDDIGVYFFAKDERNLTSIAEQKVNEKGQIEGGLRSFYEPSIRALEEFFGSERTPENVNPAK